MKFKIPFLSIMIRLPIRTWGTRFSLMSLLMVDSETPNKFTHSVTDRKSRSFNLLSEAFMGLAESNRAFCICSSFFFCLYSRFAHVSLQHFVLRVFAINNLPHSTQFFFRRILLLIISPIIWLRVVSNSQEWSSFRPKAKFVTKTLNLLEMGTKWQEKFAQTASNNFLYHRVSNRSKQIALETL